MSKASLLPYQKILMVLGAGALLSVYEIYPGIISGMSARGSLSVYAGSRLLRGELPYRDIWYDGLPGVVLANAAALGVWRSGVSVLVHEMLFLGVAALEVYLLARVAGRPKETGISAAGLLFFSAVALMSLGRVNGAGEWALPFVGGFFLGLRAVGEREGKMGIAGFLAGVSGGAALMFVPGAVFLLIIGVFYLGRRAAVFVAGFLVAPALFLSVLGFSGCEGQFYESVVEHNGIILAAKFLRPGFEGGAAAVVKALVAMLPFGVMLVRPWRGASPEKRNDRRFEAAVGACLALEVCGVVAGGGMGASSFIPALVPAAVLWSLRVEVGRGNPGREKMSRLVTALCLAGLMGPAVHAMEINTGAGRQITKLTSHNEGVVKNIVERSTGPGARVLLWSGSAALLFVVDKPPATRYATIGPLFVGGYREKAAAVFLEGISERKPEMIILETSILADGLREYFAGWPAMDISGRWAEVLLGHIQKLMREEYTTVAVHDGIIIAVRRAPGETGGPVSEKRRPGKTAAENGIIKTRK